MLLAVALSACLQTEIQELKIPFECPEQVLQIRVSGDHELLEEFVRVDIDRSEVAPSSIYPVRTVEAANAALRAMHWIVSKGYEVKEFAYTVEDRNGDYICTVRVESEKDDDHVMSGDCAGAGKGADEDKPQARPISNPGPTEGDIDA